MSEKVFFNMGKWGAEYDRDGNCTGIVYDEGYLGLLGAAPDERDSKNLWRSIIHPDDLQKIDDVYEELFLKHPEGMDYDWESRMLTGGEYHRFHFFGHCTRREDGSVRRIDGVLFDIQDIVDGQNAQKSLAQNNTRFFALEDNFEALYDVNLESGHYVSFDRDEFYSRNISERLVSATEFFEDLRTNVDRVVYEKDRDAVYNIQTKEAIIRGLSEKDRIDHYYRIVTENGLMWLKMRIVYKDAEKTNVIIGIFNAEEEMAAREKEEHFKEQLIQTNARLFALEDRLESLYDVNLDSGHYEVSVKGDFYKDNVLEKLAVPKDYFEELRANIDAVIYEEDRDGLYHALTREAIRKELSANNYFDYYYRLNTNNRPVWFKMRLVYKDNKKENVIIGVFNAEEEIRAKQREAEEAEKILESVAGIYRFAFAVDMTDSYFKVIKMDDEVKRALPVWDFKNYQEAINPLFGWIHPGDKERMTHELDFDTIRKKLKDTDSYRVEYRVIDSGSTNWHEMNVTHIAGDRVAMGFGEKDLEITKRHIEERRYNECFGLYEIDLDTGMLKVVIDSPYYTFSETGKPVPYTAAMTKFAKCQVKETRSFLLNLADVDWVKETLSKDNRHSFSYYSVTAGNTWVELTCYVTMRHDDGTPAMFALEYSFLSQTGVARQEMQRRLNQSSHIISGLASGYLTMYYLNIDEGAFAVYSLDGEKYPISDKIVSEGKDPFEMLRAFGASEVVHPDDRYLFADMNAEELRKRLEGQKRFSIRFRRTEGDSYIWTGMDAVKYEKPEEKANAVIIGFSDCDEEIRKEMEQQRLLEEARVAADAANRAKSNFLFNMSHDIRTPMNAIRGFTAMAKKNSGNEKKTAEYLDKIDISGQQLLTLVNQVLEMARIESGKIDFEEIPVHIMDEFLSMVTVFTEQAAAKGLHFDYSINNVTHSRVLADEARVTSVTMNIIGNAMKYTPEGGTIRFNLEEIPGRKPGYATFVFTVADNGIGMSKDFLEKLYEPFSREKSSTVSKIQGTGLGLSIVKSTIDLMGGNIEVQSEPGKGTRFDITVDFKINEEAEEAKEKEEEELAMISFEGRRVLLVEDNEMNREIARDILEEQGLIVEDAEDGDIAVEMVRKAVSRGEYRYYDFVLMDVQMPKMNGYEATRAIREIQGPEDVHIPIIAMTANAFEEDRQNALAAGMDEHLAKPIDIQKMFTTIAKYLK